MFKRFLFMLMGFLLIQSSCRRSQTGRRADDLYRRGLAAARKGQLARAEALLEQASGLVPKRLGMWRSLAKVRVGLGHLDEAVQALERGLSASRAADSERYPALLDLAAIRRRQGKDNAAAAVLGQAIDEQPGKVQAYWRLGATYEAHSQWSEASGVYRKLLSQHTSHGIEADALSRLARVARRSGRMEQSLSSIRKALAVSGVPAMLRSRIEAQAASLLLLHKEADAALAHLRKSVALDAGNGRNWFSLATLLRERMGCRAALPALRKALQLMPKAPDVMRLGALCLGMSSDSKDRERSYHLAMDAHHLNPSDDALTLLTAELLLARQQPGQAKALLDGLEGKPAWKANVRYWLARGRALQALDRHLAAYHAYSAAVALAAAQPVQPIQPDGAAWSAKAGRSGQMARGGGLSQSGQSGAVVTNGRGAAGQGMRGAASMLDQALAGQAVEAVWSGRYRRATVLLTSLLRRRKDDITLLVHLAVAEAMLGRMGRAARILGRAERLSPHNGLVVLYRAWLSLRTGRTKVALESIRDLASRPGALRIQALDVMGQALLRIGRKDEARTVLNQALGLARTKAKKAYFQSMLQKIGTGQPSHKPTPAVSRRPSSAKSADATRPRP
ncbi:MAG: hypothetical protein J7M25_09070 [Deltaproteobacteria bacterium]|nr:hypothetical protein [Deltaproteobacteria bacterium]